MFPWSIDNYDGQDRYDELHLQTSGRHKIEPRMEPELFDRMRAMMVIIEGEMDEVLEEHQSTHAEEKVKEWHKLKEVALSICDDYIPDLEIHTANFDVQEGKHVAEVRDDHVVLNHGVSQNALKGRRVNKGGKDSGQRSRCSRSGKDDRVYASLSPDIRQQFRREESTTISLKNRRCSAEESHHEPGDQDVFVVRNGHVRVNPREADGKWQGWTKSIQEYKVKGWPIEEVDENQRATKHIGCFTKGCSKFGRRRKVNQYDEESGEDVEQMVCNMTGQRWEKLPFPVIIDSGACASVMPTDWCDHLPIQLTRGSEFGEFFRAANGVKIPNEGERLVSMMTREGHMRDMKFIVCPVTKALGSVSQMCKTGHRVVFNPPWEQYGSYIEHLGTGEKLWLEDHNGLYVLNAKVAPNEKQTVKKWNSNQGFPGQVVP